MKCSININRNKLIKLKKKYGISYLFFSNEVYYFKKLRNE